MDVNMIVGLIEGDEVLSAELVGVRSGAAAALEATARGRVEREGEEVLQLDEVGDEAAAEEEVAQAKNVGREHGDQHDVKNTLPGLGAARGVILGFQRGVEALVLRGGEDGYGGGVVPVVDEGGVVAAHDEGAAGHDGESFGDGGQRRVERGAGGDELGEEASDGGFAVGDAGVQAERRGPVDCDVDPVSVQDAVGGRRIRTVVGEIVAGIITPGRQRASAEAGLVVGRADGSLRLPDGAQHVGRRGAVWRRSKKIQRINP